MPQTGAALAEELDRVTALMLAALEGAGWRVTPVGDRGRVRVERAPGLPVADLEGDPEALVQTCWHRLDPDRAGLAFGAAEAAVRAFLAGPLTG